VLSIAVYAYFVSLSNDVYRHVSLRLSNVARILLSVILLYFYSDGASDRHRIATAAVCMQCWRTRWKATLTFFFSSSDRGVSVLCVLCSVFGKKSPVLSPVLLPFNERM